MDELQIHVRNLLLLLVVPFGWRFALHDGRYIADGSDAGPFVHGYYDQRLVFVLQSSEVLLAATVESTIFRTPPRSRMNC